MAQLIANWKTAWSTWVRNGWRVFDENPYVVVCSILLMGMYIKFLKPIFEEFAIYQIRMQKQIFDLDTSVYMSYIIPGLMVIGFVTLFVPKTRFWGLVYSVGLMLVFSLYIGSVMLGLWDKDPCSCISAIKNLTWEKQLYFNLSFMLVALSGAIVKRKEKR